MANTLMSVLLSHYTERFNSLVSRYDKQKARYDELNVKIAEIRTNDKVMENFIRTLKETDAGNGEFDDRLWSIDIRFSCSIRAQQNIRYATIARNSNTIISRKQEVL